MYSKARDFRALSAWGYEDTVTSQPTLLQKLVTQSLQTETGSELGKWGEA